MIKKKILIYILLLLVIGFLSINDFSETKTQISYREQIPGSTITHSGKTIEEVLGNKESLNDNEKALLQKYLEKYSYLLNSQLVEKNDMEEDLINIVDHYPLGTGQPAWVDLFREGRFQLHYNSDLIRVFVQGNNPKEDFEKYKSIVRFPIRSVINSDDTEIKEIEVYSFENDYSSQEITLYEKPYTINIDDLNLKINKKSIDLKSIQNMLNKKANLEALEITDNDELYFYGKLDEKATLANEDISLSDIAVAYRALFHYGYNRPYISLDKHENNKYAKVNFGGYLGNTRAGYVLLEGDKFFKTLSIGLDPNTYELVSEDMKKVIPGFLTKDERTLLNSGGFNLFDKKQINFVFDNNIRDNSETQSIRYWFYPERITTLSDGNYGVIQNSQFLAGSERMDKDVTLDKATKNTISHLNNNYQYYESYSNKMKELSNLGKILGLINWLKEENIDNKVDLDQLLSVELPAFKTANKTNKLLATTALIYPSGEVNLNKNNIAKYTSVLNHSDLLKETNENMSDQYYMKLIKEDIDTEELYNSYEPYYNLKEEINRLENEINKLDKEIDSLRKKIDNQLVDRYNSEEVNKYNNLINEYNDLIKTYEKKLNEYNNKIEKINNMELQQQTIVSIGGGISLNPTEFRRPIYSENAAEISQIKNIKSFFKNNGQFFEYDNWVKSDYTGSKVYYNELPAIN